MIVLDKLGEAFYEGYLEGLAEVSAFHPLEKFARGIVGRPSLSPPRLAPARGSVGRATFRAPRRRLSLRPLSSAVREVLAPKPWYRRPLVTARRLGRRISKLFRR